LGEAGQETRQSQEPHRTGQTRDQRGPRHQHDAEDQHALAPEAVTEVTGWHLHRYVSVKEHGEEEAFGVAQAELRHDGREHRREGHTQDVVADRAEDEERPHGVVCLPGHGDGSDQVRIDGSERIIGDT